MRPALITLLAWLCSALAGTVASAETPPASNPAQAAKDRTVVETLLRLPGMNANANPAWKGAVLRHLETVRGTPRYLELVEKLKLTGVEDELFRLALEDPQSSAGAKAAVLLARQGGLSRLQTAATGPDAERALQAIAALGNVGDQAVLEILRPLVTRMEGTNATRNAAARAIARNRDGQRFLLDLAEKGQLPADVRFTAADVLLSSADPAIRVAAAKHLSLPAAANQRPLPPIAELVKRRGEAESGRRLFAGTATCAKCHQVRGEGKRVGPDLSEIGSKLAKDALLVSILDPSAGISHNYESYTAVTSSGRIVSGVLVSRTEQSVTLRTAEAVDLELPLDQLDELQKSPVSLMPADLQKNLSEQDLLDIVEYLLTLRK